jgi:hypothetical protein
MAHDEAGMALSGAVANFTFTAAHARDGLVPFLNDVTRSPSSRTVLVSLPAGTVRRGTGALDPSPGLTILLQGQGKDGAGGTTLDLERQNLDLRATLGDDGRIEFHRLRMTNVRALPRSTRLLPCAHPMQHCRLCRALRYLSSSLAAAQCGRRWQKCWIFVCFCVCLRRLSTSLEGVHARASPHAHTRGRTRMPRRIRVSVTSMIVPMRVRRE